MKVLRRLPSDFAVPVLVLIVAAAFAIDGWNNRLRLERIDTDMPEPVVAAAAPELAVRYRQPPVSVFSPVVFVAEPVHYRRVVVRVRR